jgi:hypothetical protein
MTSAEPVLPHQPFPPRAAILVGADQDVEDSLLVRKRAFFFQSCMRLKFFS